MIDNKTLDKWTDILRPAITATFPQEDAMELIQLWRKFKGYK